MKDRIALGASDWLALAAAPTFALMALFTSLSGQPEILCSSAHASPFGGMTQMYLLMAAFHSQSWLKLLNR